MTRDERLKLVQAAKRRLEPARSDLGRLKEELEDFQLLREKTLKGSFSVFDWPIEKDKEVHQKLASLVRTLDSIVQEYEDCVVCKGDKVFRKSTGEVISDPCDHCEGTGLETGNETRKSKLAQRAFMCAMASTGSGVTIPSDLRDLKGYLESRRLYHEQELLKLDAEIAGLQPSEEEEDLESFETERAKKIGDLRRHQKNLLAIQSCWGELWAEESSPSVCDRCSGSDQKCVNCRGFGTQRAKRLHEGQQQVDALVTRFRDMLSRLDMDPDEETKEEFAS